MVSGVTISTTSVYWYQERPGQAIQHLLHIFSNNTVKRESGILLSKFEAHMTPETSTSTLTVHNVREQDSATYYCALWDMHDRRLDGDLFPKPTIFFPSVEEVKLHMAGTHLCLLQKFFPDAIKVQWKEKNGNTILESQQGDIIKTNDTYMKFSWLTLTKKAMDKEHVCIVKHENNKGGRDQEILFSSVKK
ncbi:hypothetical protein Celaphus_00012179, partial [Cervus elaphus hippelaphus]